MNEFPSFLKKIIATWDSHSVFSIQKDHLRETTNKNVFFCTNFWTMTTTNSWTLNLGLGWNRIVTQNTRRKFREICEDFKPKKCTWFIAVKSFGAYEKRKKPDLFGKKHQNIQEQNGFVTNLREQSRLAVPQFPKFGNSNQIGCRIFSLGEVIGFGFEVPPTGVLSVQSGVDGAFAQSQNNIYWLPNREIKVNPFPENPEKNTGAFLGVDPFRNYAREP